VFLSRRHRVSKALYTCHMSQRYLKKGKEKVS
jgi:hypothetical protein